MYIVSSGEFRKSHTIIVIINIRVVIFRDWEKLLVSIPIKISFFGATFLLAVRNYYLPPGF